MNKVNIRNVIYSQMRTTTSWLSVVKRLKYLISCSVVSARDVIILCSYRIANKQDIAATGLDNFWYSFFETKNLQYRFEVDDIYYPFPIDGIYILHTRQLQSFWIQLFYLLYFFLRPSKSATRSRRVYPTHHYLFATGLLSGRWETYLQLK